MKTMSELYKALSIEDSLTTLESRFYEKEEIQNFIKELKENIILEANKTQDLNQIVFENSNLIIYWDLLSLRATMPSKRDEDAGVDIYTIENEAVL